MRGGGQGQEGTTEESGSDQSGLLSLVVSSTFLNADLAIMYCELNFAEKVDSNKSSCNQSFYIKQILMTKDTYIECL